MAHEFRRLARTELKSARKEIRKTQPPRDEAIHQARKRVKKVRAIVQLIDDGGGRGLDRSAKRLRSVNRTLSELRDTDAMMQTLASLRRRHRRLFSEHTFARIHRGLATRKRDAFRAAERARAWSSIAQRLEDVRSRTKRWRPAHRGYTAFANAIRAVHQRGRKAMKRAQTRQRAEDFHAWRKEIKALWYALRLIERSGSRIRHDIRALHQAETWLGEEHNLVVLCDELSRDTSVCQGPVQRDRFRSIADRDQCGLRAKAIARVRRVYQRRSGAYARGVAHVWTGWRRRTRQHRVRGTRSAA